ncbi:MAG: hypothetical protein EXR72_10790 [Myxococcales bacterium]|nr:hypothetical protein [Myxococcales bacterium]
MVSVGVPARVAPGGSLAVTITARNTGTTTCTASAVKLAFTGEGTWSGATLTLAAATKTNQIGTFSGTLGASKQIGTYPLWWRAQSTGVPFGPSIAAATEITCSDGAFCNGDERSVNGKCVTGPAPCDDGQACTIDLCDDPSGVCAHQLTGGSCLSCAVKNCNPNCHGAPCGDDGCGGSCGSCAVGQVCSAGACVVADIPGTCSTPLPIVAGADPNVALAPGFYVATGDTTDGFNEAVPTCNSASTAQEKIYQLVVDQQMGLDAQSYDFDTVLHVRTGGCGGATIGCSDDSAPSGAYGSHVAVMLNPGTYYIIVDGFDDHSYGPYHLALRLVAGCLPQCDGKFCGDDGCGGTCGDCGVGQICSAKARCISDPCKPVCQGRQCGSDGCGGICGTCQVGKACEEFSGACKNIAACNNARPVCPTKCASTEYCGSDCVCHRSRDPRPDLVVNKIRLLCDNQGIQAGWSDLYGNALDCQWLDVTGIPSGNYQLRVSLNPSHAFEEASFDNNTATVPVTIP